nr:DUF222 domain-containing protein [Actinomyces provencensis]
MTGSCSAAQTHAALALEDARETRATTPGEREAAHRSVVSEIALARRESPHRARTLLGLATALHTELPHTLAHLAAGRISEYRATLVAKETACLDPQDRRVADRELAEGLPSWSNREVSTHARHIAYTLDPHAMVTHIERAEGDRHVTIRPAPACMALITALLPAAQGVAVHAALLRAAESAHATGDARARAQVMADTLVTRITGQDRPETVPIEVRLVITDDTLLGQGDTPARLIGYGPVPPTIARRLLTHTTSGSGSGDDRDNGTGSGSGTPPMTPRPRPVSGSDASTPTPQPANSSPWNPPAASSHPACAATSPPATPTPAARPGAGHPSPTSTTSRPHATEAPPLPPTAKACASTATRPRKHPAGTHTPTPTAPSP